MINNSTTLVNALNKTILKTTAEFWGFCLFCFVFFTKSWINISKTSGTLYKKLYYLQVVTSATICT